MISLQEPSSPYTLDLAYGIHVTVKPLTTSSMLIAQAKARQKAEKYQRQADERMNYGLGDTSNPDDKDEDESENNALYQLYLLPELACSHIIDWQGVSLNDKSAPLTPENIKAVMELYPVGEKFLGEFTLKQMLLNSAKKDYGLSGSGTPPLTAGPTTAKDALTPANAPKDVPTIDTPPKR